MVRGKIKAETVITRPQQTSTRATFGGQDRGEAGACLRTGSV